MEFIHSAFCKSVFFVCRLQTKGGTSMFNQVKRMVTMWSDVEASGILSPEYRVNRYSPRIVHHDITIGNLSEVQRIFANVQGILNGKCVTIQIFFTGDIPKNTLSELGFTCTCTSEKIWKTNHKSLSVSAILLDATDSWVLQLTKRRGSGISCSALRFDELFNQLHQVQFEIQNSIMEEGIQHESIRTA